LKKSIRNCFRRLATGQKEEEPIAATVELPRKQYTGQPRSGKYCIDVKQENPNTCIEN
jgi:hypothetical protein